MKNKQANKQANKLDDVEFGFDAQTMNLRKYERNAVKCKNNYEGKQQQLHFLLHSTFS